MLSIRLGSKIDSVFRQIREDFTKMQTNGHRQNGVQPARPLKESLDDPKLVLSRWQEVVYPLILWTAHLVFRWTVVLYLTVIKTFRKAQMLSSSMSAFFGRQRRLQYSVDYCQLSHYLSLEKESTRLTKKPCHVAFVLNESYLDLKAIARLTTWALACGINNISIYDYHGKLKGLQSQLIDALRHYMAKEKQDSSICWRSHCPGQQPTVIVHLETGSQRPRNPNDAGMPNISLLSAEDGKQDLSVAAGNIAREVKSGVIRSEDINEALVSSMLNSNRGMPDPDVMIRFGLTSCNMGFLPWQIRLTEIHDLPSHADALPSDFFGVLCKYSKCEQRFGK